MGAGSRKSEKVVIIEIGTGKSIAAYLVNNLPSSCDVEHLPKPKY